MRKPDLSFYRYVLEEIKLGPEEVVFIDDMVESVLAARSLGINSVVFNNNFLVASTLRSIFKGLVGRAHKYLRRNAKHFDSVSANNIVILDTFLELLILDGTQDR